MSLYTKNDVMMEKYDHKKCDIEKKQRKVNALIKANKKLNSDGNT